MQDLVEWVDRTSGIIVGAFDEMGKAFVDALSQQEKDA